MEENQNNDRQEIYSERVRAGKRTYFFDIKATRANDYYLTITESKRRYKDGEEGFFYEKHKIFLYKEDFNKFVEALNTTVNHVKTELLPEVDFSEFDREKEEYTKQKQSETSEEQPSETSEEPPSESSDNSELKWD